MSVIFTQYVPIGTVRVSYGATALEFAVVSTLAAITQVVPEIVPMPRFITASVCVTLTSCIVTSPAVGTVTDRHAEPFS